MVKILLIFIITTSVLYGQNIFKENCLSCHTDKEQLQYFMAEYTLRYSSKERITKAIFKFLRSPSSNRSIMPYEFIKENGGFKENSALSDQKLQEAIDIYYDQYNLQQRIR